MAASRPLVNIVIVQPTHIATYGTAAQCLGICNLLLLTFTKCIFYLLLILNSCIYQTKFIQIFSNVIHLFVLFFFLNRHNVILNEFEGITIISSILERINYFLNGLLEAQNSESFANTSMKYTHTIKLSIAGKPSWSHNLYAYSHDDDLCSPKGCYLLFVFLKRKT